MYNYVLAEASVLNLSFAVSVIDDYTQQPELIGDTEVILQSDGRKALRNRSGYHFFTDLSEDDVQIKIKNKFYFEKVIEVTISDLDQRLPLIEEVLKPNYLYPFPEGATTIRGKVYDEDLDVPISDVSVKIKNSDISNASDESGRFVLYFGPLTEDDIDVQNGHRYITVNNKKKFKVAFEHVDYRDNTENIGQIEEGEKKLIRDAIYLRPR